jgi:hypothetical protein
MILKILSIGQPRNKEPKTTFNTFQQIAIALLRGSERDF